MRNREPVKHATRRDHLRTCIKLYTSLSERRFPAFPQVRLIDSESVFARLPHPPAPILHPRNRHIDGSWGCLSWAGLDRTASSDRGERQQRGLDGIGLDWIRPNQRPETKDQTHASPSNPLIRGFQGERGGGGVDGSTELSRASRRRAASSIRIQIRIRIRHSVNAKALRSTRTYVRH